MNLVKRTRPFYKISENDIVINTPITRELLDNNKLENTILDIRLEQQCGYIKLKKGMYLYNYYIIKKKIKNLLFQNVDPKYIYYKNKDSVYIVNKDEYLRIPKEINKIYELENGLKVLTNLQRAYNNIIIENNTLRTKDENIVYQNIYNKLLLEYNNLLCGKGGLFDRGTNALWPCSCRTTVVNNPNLKINEINIPYQVLINWISKEEVREAFNIDKNLSNREAVKFLEGKRVLVGRQPSHDRSNLMSFIIKM